MAEARIPHRVIVVVSAVFESYRHADLDAIFAEAGARVEPPQGNTTKIHKVRQWLQQIDADPAQDAIAILGRVLRDYMENPPDDVREEGRRRIREVLAQEGLSYLTGGKILGGALFTPSQTLADLIRACDLPAVHAEFDRAMENVESDPATAVTAACAILESTCRTIIADEKLTLPSDQSIHPLWKVVQGHLGLAPSAIQEGDLKRVLGGLASIVDGVGAFRTHAGSAHGRDAQAAPIEPRHARLAVYAAHTVVTFILETWKR